MLQLHNPSSLPRSMHKWPGKHRHCFARLQTLKDVFLNRVRSLQRLPISLGVVGVVSNSYNLWKQRRSQKTWWLNTRLNPAQRSHDALSRVSVARRAWARHGPPSFPVRINCTHRTIYRIYSFIMLYSYL